MDLGRAWTERPINTSRRLWLSVIVAATATMLCTLGLSAVAGQAARAATVPVVTGVSPSTGAAVGRTLVTITGSGFTGATKVDFGPVPVYGLIQAGSFTVVSDTEITATFSQNGNFAGTTTATATTPAGTSATSAADQITFVLPPVTTLISPDNGPMTGGNTVAMITGTGFTGATRVDFNTSIIVNGVPGVLNLDAPTFTVDSDTQITAVVPALPAGASRGAEVFVTTPYGNSFNSLLSYVWNNLPLVQSSFPSSGVTLGGNRSR